MKKNETTTLDDRSEEFVIENYGKKSTFASFLLGIAGEKGIPIWCYYVNRGQGVVSFGVDNKDHAIMEFYPAHQAYQNVKTTGFRTFLKKDGKVSEAFSKEDVKHQMKIAKNSLTIEERNEETGMETKVNYFVLPGEQVGALVRKVTIRNIANESATVEVLDGMPAVIPYGVGLDSMKNMCQTAKAWMQVEDLESKVPYFRVRASMDDTAAVKAIAGGNFSFACLEDGTKLQPIVDAEVIFKYDTSMREAVGFMENSIEELFKEKQNTMNLLPCNFYGVKRTLEAGESISLYEVVGQVEKKEILAKYLKGKKDFEYFETKREEAERLVEEVCNGITTKTASKEFDAYCKYTYMDNVLRGGYPIQLGNNKIFYVYSRKHGDLERDYNYFAMLPEFYSQGNGNFRDVNQNRRCDTFFAPFVGRENIKAFYSFIQLDGYNPLGIEKITYQLSKEKAKLFPELKDFVTKPFTPGSLYSEMSSIYGDEIDEKIFFQIIDFADSLVNGNFGEGYWSDHWTYNLDLIQDYLEVYPEKEQEMLFEEDYTCFLSQVNVNPREMRYEETENGLRQYYALDEKNKRNTSEKLVRTKHQQGSILKMTLLEKLVLLCTTKFATLDAYGMGIEMEGGKPGWYDALNGMPGMFGSSMAETYELCRTLEYTTTVLKKYPATVKILAEVANYMEVLDTINQKEQSGTMAYWNQINDAKEEYRNIVFAGVAGEKKEMHTEEVAGILNRFLETVRAGIERACELSGGICPTYFTYEVPEYVKTEKGYRPLRFEVREVPYFLEGPVRYLKLKNSKEKKLELYKNIKNSDLYDEKLQMYKVNASLQNASFELGRARAFTPGWLENESIWLHMEYKYLLELLKNGMYQEFFNDFEKAAVPFLDPEVYGRSIYENSSFIVSSKNPNEAIHGKGFVARLSGSTIEFISMWKYMMFGPHVLSVKNDELTFSPQPAVPAYLIPEDGRVSAMLFGKTEVCYQFADVMDYIPGRYQIKTMKFTYRNGSVANVTDDYAGEQIAKDVRDGMIRKVEIEIV